MMNVVMGVKLSVGAGGNNDLVKIYENGRIYAKNVIAHPDYNPETQENDIALLDPRRFAYTHEKNLGKFKVN